jgi:hypothetical protein
MSGPGGLGSINVGDRSKERRLCKSREDSSWQSSNSSRQGWLLLKLPRGCGIEATVSGVIAKGVRATNQL